MAIFEYIPADGAVTETIDFAGGDPTDVYQVELTGGDLYYTSVLGASNGRGTLQDPNVTVYDSENNIIFEQDDSLFGLDPFFSFQAPTNGIYYIEVSDSIGSSGSYTFDVNLSTVDSGTFVGVPESPLPLGLPPEERGRFLR